MEKGYILILNGPNINLLGRREPEIYGTETLADILSGLRNAFAEQTIKDECYNGEAELVEAIQRVGFDSDCCGIVLNAAAYTHTSLALADAIAAVPVPVVEVHLTNIYAREDIRRTSLIAPVCKGSISGFGSKVYYLGVQAILSL